MRLTLSLVPLLAALSLSLVAALPAFPPVRGEGSRHNLLVVLDSKEVNQDDYSSFWSSLQARGYELTFRDARSTGAVPNKELLARFEEPQYDGLIVFAPSLKTLPADLSPQSLYSFLTKPSPTSTVPGNILLALSPSVSEPWRDFAREFNIEFDERDTTLYDPLGRSNSTNGKITVDVSADKTFISSPASEGEHAVYSSTLKRSQLPIRYSGLVHATSDLPILTPLLRAPSTAYPVELSSGPSLVPVEGGPLVSGEQAKLVSGFQTRANSRIVWSGSVNLFSNEHWDESMTSNAAFVKDTTQWLFQEKNVLQVKRARHYKTGDSTKALEDQYRIGHNMTYEITIAAYSDGRWSAPSSVQDIQLEVTMLDPHLRIPLHPSTDIAHRSTSERTYTATFRLPDRHGVFTLLVDHRRQGASWLESRMQTSITPLRHDEYERFIKGATPYYLTAGSVVLAWLVFSAIYLSTKDEEKPKRGKKKAM